MFIKELALRSNIAKEDSRTLFKSIPTTKLCRVHDNHTRHSMDYAQSQDVNRIGERQGLCVFTNNGCTKTCSILRPLSMFGTSSIEDTEMYCEYVDVIESLSGGMLSIDDVSGRQACPTCRYVLSKGASGVRPNFPVYSLEYSSDRCLVDCVLYSLDAEVTDTVFKYYSENLSKAANDLRGKVICPFLTIVVQCTCL